jgi:S-DNA-T family DNA segregation ATPase FtsK/SpoIIIE
MRIGLTALTPQGPRDVLVQGDDLATTSQVAAGLRRALDSGGRLAPVIALPTAGRPRSGDTVLQGGYGETLWLDGRALDPRAPAATVLRDGALVALDPRAAAATSVAEPSGLVEVRVAGGPDAGAVHRLGLGAAMLGASPDCAVHIGGPGLPAYAVRLVVGPGDAAGEVMAEPLRAPADDQPLLLDGEPLTAPRPWRFGTMLQIGDHVLTVARPEPPDAHLSPAGDGGLAYNRPPRLAPVSRPRRIEVPAEPRRGDKPRLQLLAALLPLAFGVIMIKVMHSAYYALFMLMSPVMVMGTWASERRHGRVTHNRAMKDYRARVADLDAAIATERAADEAARREASPDPAEVLLTATGPRRRLWERRGTDQDALHLRIGLADLPANIEFVPERGGPVDIRLPAVPAARSVPVPLPLPDLGVIGLAGAAGNSRALARWLVAQAATLHSPRDLMIVVLVADPAAGPDWNWVRWLPHCAPRDGADCLALVGADPESAARRVAELAGEAARRFGQSSQAGGYGRVAAAGLGPDVLLVLDGARALRRITGMPQVLAARQVGMYAICIDEAERLLPEECAAVASFDQAEPAWLTLRGAGLDVVGRVLADQVSLPWADRVARAMAPVRDVSQDDADALIPSSVRLLDLIGMPEPAPDQVCALWQRHGRSTLATIGVGADGLFGIDVRADGPHGLIAGTTGAGKSELLQTIIASLALVNRPDSMTFVLIDYKGGSAFKDCARLPHTVGMVTDLDGHLTERALASLSAELKRREELLLDAGAKDIEDYWDTRAREPDLAPLPRLVLVIDEFASLVAELPDFVTGLVGIAQRGRSLGVHLLLATQRPAGVVSADIRANTNLRIALRVTDAEESSDVIDVRDAAFIPKSVPGRCYVRSGAGTPAAVQSARIGGRRPGVGPAETSAVAVPVPWDRLGRPLQPLAQAGPPDDGTMETDLSVLVDAIAGAAAKLGLRKQPSPWLPPLPDTISLADLPEASGAAGPARGEVPPIPFGLTDVPASQSREPLTLDLAHGGHLLVAGAARTGRSTVLRTIAGSVAVGYSPSDVHIYGLDCGTGALLPVASLPHCGAVTSRDDADRVERLVRKLRAEISRRQQLLAAGGFAGIAEQRAGAPSAERLPWLVLLLDWWEGYIAAFEHYDYGRLVDSVLQLLREGAAVGLRAVVTTDRAALLGQAGAVFGRRMLLRPTDPSDAPLAGVSERSLPAHQPPGRLMFAGRQGSAEAQVALLDRDSAGPAQVAALRRFGEQSVERYDRPLQSLRPLRVDPLPTTLTASGAWALDPGFVPQTPLWALVGAGGDELGPQGLDVRDDGPGLVVAGPPRSGRSTALVTMASSMLQQGIEVVLVTPRRSPLRSLEGRDGVLGVLGGDAGADVLAEAIGTRERYVVVADDAELLVNGSLSDPLEKILRSGRDAEHGVILAGSTGDLGRAYSGFVPAALKSRCGLLVAVESPSDGDLFGVRLPRNAGPGPIGRGLLVRPGSALPVQIATS